MSCNRDGRTAFEWMLATVAALWIFAAWWPDVLRALVEWFIKAASE